MGNQVKTCLCPECGCDAVICDPSEGVDPVYSCLCGARFVEWYAIANDLDITEKDESDIIYGVEPELASIDIVPFEM